MSLIFISVVPALLTLPMPLQHALVTLGAFV